LKILISYFFVFEFVRFNTKLSFLFFSYKEKGIVNNTILIRFLMKKS
jgi:hypothetical protein